MGKRKDSEVEIVLKGHRTTTNELWFELNEEDLRRLLFKFVPADAKNFKVAIQVPGGGDWSNRTLPIDEITPLVVSWEVTVQEDLESKIVK